MLPIVAYAYLVQTVVTDRSEAHEREIATREVQSLACRLKRAAQADGAVCRDYAHWDDFYNQMPRPSKDWLEANVVSGIGVTFGLDLVLIQDASGATIWQKGTSAAVLQDITRYGVFQECLRNKDASGVVLLDRRAYIAAAVPIRRSDHTGRSRGMIIVARAIGGTLLGDLAADSEHKLTLYQISGEMAGARNLGPIKALPPSVAEMIGKGVLVSRNTVESSSDGTTSYGLAPLTDIRGKHVAVLMDVTSRASLVENLRAIRQMSWFLMAMCGVLGLAGMSYFRNRALALRAHRDELTGLYNHGYLQEKLKEQLEVAQRYKRPFALMMADIDHFKLVNDIHGHAAGDQVLKALSEVVVETVRGTDLVARYGGEEFVVVLRETDLHHALMGAERLRASIQKRSIRARVVQDGQMSFVNLNFTISIGVAVFPEDGAEPRDILMAADAALTEAKRTRNAVRAYHEITQDDDRGSKRLPVLDSFLRDRSMSTVRSMVAAIDVRDPDCAHHSEKVAEYAVAIGRDLQFSTQDLALTCNAALLHDVGKIGIPDHILTKTGGLTEDEMVVVRRHSKAGADILAESPVLAPMSEIVLCHHERFDGSGYPGGLTDDAIPTIARVIGIADALDAMTSSRSYRQPRSFEEARNELIQQSGVLFDPKIVDAAVRVISHLIGEDEVAAA